MSNATDTYEYITSGFCALLARLRAIDNLTDIRKRIRLNTAAREAARERICKEYAAIGTAPPSDLALSITARRVMAEVDAGRAGMSTADWLEHRDFE
jgi:hypothetical protein